MVMKLSANPTQKATHPALSRRSKSTFAAVQFLESGR